MVVSLPDRLRGAQAAFEATGGLHATGLFTADGELVYAREDVGRHNALDKVIGRAFLDGLLPLGEHVLCVSGRLSFELVQKAAVAGCPILVAVGAPSSLAVELAADRGITLCGFVRGGTANVYTEPWRIDSLTGILLAGGTSTRFGSPKELAEFEGETLGDRAWRLLGEACDERIRVGPGGLDDPGTGPVAAIAAGLRAASHEIAVVIPVDMPLLTAAALTRARRRVPRRGGRAERAASVRDPPRCVPETDERRLRTVLAGLDTVSIRLPEEVLANVNDRDDLQRLG